MTHRLWQDSTRRTANKRGMTQVSDTDARLDDGRPPALVKERLAALDVCRGLAILVVVFIHVSGHFLPALHPARSAPYPGWWALAVPNQAAQWAVPCFLMLSALVNARSVAGGDLGRYGRRRVQTALLPYLFWSFFYVAVGVIVEHQPRPGAHALLTLLQTGKAWYHLYFFVLVLEMYVLLPLLVPVFKRRPPFWAVALGATVMQAGIYLLNRFVSLHSFQSTILWDILPVALGLWLWSRPLPLPEVLKKALWPSLAVVALGLAAYLPLAVAYQRDPHQTALTYVAGRWDLTTAVFQFGQWGYAAGMSVFVLALSAVLGSNRLSKVLGFLGAESLIIYVLHPLAILALDKRAVNHHAGTAAGLVIYYIACLALPLAAGWVWQKIRPQKKT